MTDLKPCPFCGGEAKIARNIFPPGKPYRYHPTCVGIGSIGPNSTGWLNCPGVVDEQDEQGGTCCDFPTEEQAIAAWNRRASGWISVEERLPALLERVLIYCGIDTEIDPADPIVHIWAAHLVKTGDRQDKRTWRLCDECNDTWTLEPPTHWQPLPEPPEEK